MKGLALLALVACGGSSEAPVAPRKRSAPPAEEPIRAEPTAAFDAWVVAEKQGLPGAPAQLLEVVVSHVGPLGRDCAAGSEIACALFADAYDAALAVAQQDRAASSPRLAAGCQAGDRMVCALAIEVRDDPGGTSKETPWVIAELQKLCSAGLAHACVRAANIRIGSGLAVPELGEEAANRQLEQGCAGGSPDACSTLVALAGAIPPPDEYPASAQFAAARRACRIGEARACSSLLTHLTPAPSFGCSLCDPARDAYLESGEWDERCQECSIAKCRRENCCATCALREKAACCVEEAAGVPEHPDRPPPADPAAWRRAGAAARRATARARDLWQVGCKRGLTAWCRVVAELDEQLAALEKPAAP